MAGRLPEAPNRAEPEVMAMVMVSGNTDEGRQQAQHVCSVARKMSESIAESFGTTHERAWARRRA